MLSSASRLSRISDSSSTTRMRPLGMAMACSSADTISGIHRFPLDRGGAGSGCLGPRQGDVESGSTAWAAEDFYGAPVLLNDAVADRKAEAGSFASRLGGEERVVDA